MAKRVNRLKAIDHELQQLQNLKTLEPNTTPPRYGALSDALVDVAATALGIVRALEHGETETIDFEKFYDLVDSLEESLNVPAE